MTLHIILDTDRAEWRWRPERWRSQHVRSLRWLCVELRWAR